VAHPLCRVCTNELATGFYFAPGRTSGSSGYVHDVEAALLLVSGAAILCCERCGHRLEAEARRGAFKLIVGDAS
jgi:hypothetical protein